MSSQLSTQVVPYFSSLEGKPGYSCMVQVTDLDGRSASLLVTEVDTPGDPQTNVRVNNSAGLRIPLASFGWLEYDAAGRPGTWRQSD